MSGGGVGSQLLDRPLNSWRLRRLALSLLVALGVVLGILAATELVARALFFRAGTPLIGCMRMDDVTTGVLGRPHSTCVEKTFETGPVRYTFNDCGFRTELPCGPKPPGVLRIVTIGSSIVEGLRVPAEQGFASQLSRLLSARLGRPVQVFNQGMQWGTPSAIAQRTQKILAVEPDLVLWGISPWDIDRAAVLLPATRKREIVVTDDLGERAPIRRTIGGTPSLWRSIVAIPHRLAHAYRNSRTAFMLRYALNSSDSEYLRTALAKGSRGYLRPDPAPLWSRRKDLLAEKVGDVARALREAGVPLVLTSLPNRLQATLISGQVSAEHIDPLQFERTLRSITVLYGTSYINVANGFAQVARPSRLYLPIDGHPTAAGHAVLANAMARDLSLILSDPKSRHPRLAYGDLARL